ncbi:sensor histidine kinase [Amycolatopsis aidingensis]|uniref:sensor histidine kinase n=1 Tax=Amycolatopsis aidingensis TaxID=2842453 RepID=UPI001C0B297B|nr:ATP-binding protein [Amycolatopsis aidingensis]
MATRARELLDRSRGLLDRSRVAAAHFLAGTRQEPEPARTALPSPPPDPPDSPAPGQATAPASERTEEALVGICASIALRDLNLVDSLLSQLERMEAAEEDQDRLAELYQLDHLATRLRRNAENLRVLAGRDAGENATETASLVDVVRAAMSSIDSYPRVSIGRMVSLGVVGFAAEDLSRVLAEILDNAASHSSPTSSVKVSAHLTEQGSVLMRVEDEGIGLPPERLAELNDRLEGAPVLDDDAVRHMGLAVVRRLAGRHDMRVRLDRRVPHGTTATVLIPAGLVSELPEASWSGAQTVVLPPAARTREEKRATVAAGAARQPGGAGGAGGSTARAPRPKPVSKPAPAGTTASGLPRRVPRSIKNASDLAASPQRQPEPDTDPARQEEGHRQLIDDLGAFADGERAARADRPDGPDHDTSSDGTAEESQQ